jgi:triosephosphate isomerase
MRRKLIAGNWKMNGRLAANAALLTGIKSEFGRPPCDVALCVPAPYLAQCKSELADTPVAWGGQDLSEHESGAYTGDISGAMLRDFDCRYVIVGHSERRTYHLENDDLVAKKTLRALNSGLVPIVCIGETLADRESGHTDKIVGKQIKTVLAAIDAADLPNIIVAYEPVWAIGTGKTATPEMAQEVHAMVRARLAGKNPDASSQVRILYGGSMKPDNAKELLAMPDIDGGLIGGASLNASDFLAIISAA